MVNIIACALGYATAAHAGQVRKYHGEPYIIHPIRVADLVCQYVKNDPALVAAALLHDVKEDCDPKIANSIGDHFGTDVDSLVSQVTDVAKPSDGNRAARKAMDRQHLAQATARGKIIKLCDLLDNTEDITANDPEFAKVYLREKRLLLPSLFDEALPIRLFQRVHNSLQHHMANMGLE